MRFVAFLIALFAWACVCQSATVTGTLSPSHPDIYLILYNQDEDRQQDEKQQPDMPPDASPDPKTGKFVFKGVPAGKYDLVIITETTPYIARTLTGIKVGPKGLNLGTVHLTAGARYFGSIGHASRDFSVKLGKTVGLTEEDGSFEIPAVTPGKEYTLSINCECCEPYTTKVFPKKPIKYHLGKINLSPLAKITGTITVGGRLPDGKNLEVAVSALRLEDPTPEGIEFWRPGKVTPAGQNKFGYTIPNIRAGHYKLQINAGDVSVTAAEGYPARLPGSEADEKTVEDLIPKLSEVFAKGDLVTARTLTTSDCSFGNLGSDLEDFVTSRKGTFSNTKKRDILIARSGDREARAYTRALATASDKDAEEWPSEVLIEFFEMWKFARIDSGWVLSGYNYDLKTTDGANMLTIMQLSKIAEKNPGLQGLDKFKESDVTRLRIIMTDDPKLTNFEVRSGEVSSGHDWTIRLD